MFKDFFRAGFGSVGAQAINLAALPLIARLYEPEEYAVWAIVVSTAMIFGGISCLRYELAIVLPKDQRDASALFVWSMACATGMALLVALGSALLIGLGGFKPESPVYYIVFTPFLVFAMGLTLALQNWAIRLGFFSLNSGAQIGLAAVTVIVQFAFALIYSASASGLIVGSLLGQAAAVVVLITGCAASGQRPQFSLPILRRVAPMLREHYRFPLYSMPYVLFGTLRERASIFLLALFVGDREVGLFAFAYRMMNFPVSLVSAALRPVIFRESSLNGVPALEKRVNLILRWLAMLATPLLIIYFNFSEELFLLAFGSSWVDAAYFGDFIVLPVFTFMFCNWMDRILDTLGQQKLTMLFEVVFGTASIVSLWWMLEFGYGLWPALAAQCTVLIVYNLAYLVLAYDRAGYSKHSLFVHAVTVVGVAAITEMLIRMILQ